MDRVLANAFKKNASVRIESIGKLADSVGAAYGLVGTHLEWAHMTESQLAAQIEARLPELMTAPINAAPGDASEDFFGEQDALGGMDRAFAAASANSEAEADVPVGIPKSPMSWVLPVFVGGSVLVIGLVLVLWLAF